MLRAAKLLTGVGSSEKHLGKAQPTPKRVQVRKIKLVLFFLFY